MGLTRQENYSEAHNKMTFRIKNKSEVYDWSQVSLRPKRTEQISLEVVLRQDNFKNTLASVVDTNMNARRSGALVIHIKLKRKLQFCYWARLRKYNMWIWTLLSDNGKFVLAQLVLFFLPFHLPSFCIPVAIIAFAELPTVSECSFSFRHVANRPGLQQRDFLPAWKSACKCISTY